MARARWFEKIEGPNIARDAHIHGKAKNDPAASWRYLHLAFTNPKLLQEKKV
ncbi:hypothetical protein HZC09_00940 [Candidatus Micrarchaeota archaeon]|nr:hypothetical protein [Candidatus Micrarchaeota archaeon]